MGCSNLFLILTISTIASFVSMCGGTGFDLKNLFFVDNLIEKTFMPMHNIPGVSLSIVMDGEPTYAKGYGKRDLEKDLPVDNNTLFLIASVTKTFTATLVVKILHEKFPDLEDRALDTPIHKLLNSSTILSDRYRSESITFRDLLTHRACLEPMDYGLMLGAYASNLEVVNRTKYAKEFHCSFRNGGIYNNGLYALAGELIAEIGGSSYKNLMNQLFAQIGMENTSLVSDAMDYEVVENIARAYFRRGGQPNKLNSELYKRITKMLPAGGVITNAMDMGKYLKFRLSYGKVNGEQIVPEKAMKWMHEASVALPFSGFRTRDNGIVKGDYAVGSGIVLSLYDGWAVQYHGGSFSVYTSWLSLYPDLGWGIFTSINGPGTLNPFFDHKVLHESIFDILREFYPPGQLELEIEKLNFKMADSSFDTQINFPTDQNSLEIEISEMQGNYGNPVHGEFELVLNETADALYLHYGKWGTGFLNPVENFTNLYLLDLDSDVVGDFISQTPNQEILPELYFQFVDSSTVNFIFSEFTQEFKRNASFENYPPQLWDPNSCGPTITM